MEVNFNSSLIQAKQVEEAPKPLIEEYAAATVLTAIEDDDDCVICYQTLYRPARTECGHSACESCLLHWALTAMETKFGGGSAPEIPSNIAIAVDGIKFKCPTCRTYTQASFDAKRNEKLAELYPEEYRARESEIANSSPLASEDGTELVVLMIGNSHRKIPPTIDPHTEKEVEHEWTFFIKSSNQDAIEKVEVILHQSYRDRLAILKQAPFTTTRLGCEWFTIFAGIVLREGWEWVGEDMVVDSDVDNGRVRDRLPVKWLLDLNGGGSMKTQTVKVKRVKQATTESADIIMQQVPKDENLSDDEEDADFASLAAFMSESEIAQLREVRKMKRKAMKEKNSLASTN